jgi:hypothetical protein
MELTPLATSALRPNPVIVSKLQLFRFVPQADVHPVTLVPRQHKRKAEQKSSAHPRRSRCFENRELW